MNSWLLWRLLLVERSPFPLFIRIAPRAHFEPQMSIWRFLSWYTILGLFFTALIAPFMAQSVILGVLIVVFGSPAFIVVLMAFIASPFVVFGGIFSGLNIANRTSHELATLGRNAMTDLLHVTPPGRWGLLRAVSAAHLRRKQTFFGAGIYEMIYAHLTLSLGFSLPVGSMLIVLIAAQLADGMMLNTRSITVIAFVSVGIFPLLLAALLHVDFRQSLMLGVTAGIFGGTVSLERYDAWTGALAAFIGTGLIGSAVIVAVVMLITFMIPTPYTALGSSIATLAGWGLALVVRERIITWLWTRIINHEGLDIP